jgi:nitrite reductase/ring-hydroxylating ferredoxin subunit
MGDENYVAVTDADEVEDKGFACLTAGEVKLVVCRFRDEYYAVENLCSHAHSHFNNGRLRGYNLICPLHSGSFDIRDGSPTGLPAKMPIRSFPVRVVDGVVEVDLDVSETHPQGID